jgi:hypothetical protein
MRRLFTPLAVMALFAPHPGFAQRPKLVATGSPLTVEARLRTYVVQASLELADPAALLALEYHPGDGWSVLTKLDRLVLRAPGTHALEFPRRYGRLEIPAGTTTQEIVPDPGLGCGAAGGVYDSTTGDCAVGGSPSFGVVLDVPIGPADYRVAVFRLERVPTQIELEAALRAAAGEPPVVALQRLAAMMGTAERPGAWALLRIPRAP